MHIFAHTKTIYTITDYLFRCLVYLFVCFYSLLILTNLCLCRFGTDTILIYFIELLLLSSVFCVLIIWFDWRFYNQLNYFYLDSDWHVNFDILLNSVKSSLCFVSQVVDTLLHWYVSYTYLWLVADVYTKVYVMCMSKGHAFNVKLWYWSCQLGISIF